MKQQVKNREREQKWERFTNRPNHGYYPPKIDSPYQQFLVSSPKESVAVNDSNLFKKYYSPQE